MDQRPNELSASQYALRRKELLSLLKQLRATGSQSELDLPRITVIGNQSAGKSSVVEAISGVGEALCVFKRGFYTLNLLSDHCTP